MSKRSKLAKNAQAAAPAKHKVSADKVFCLLALFLLFAAGLTVYLPSFKVPFHFDDLESIFHNPYIRVTSLSPGALYSAAFQDFRQNRPLSNLTFALNYYFNVISPFGYHVFNFLVHVLSGFCVFFLLERIFTRRTKQPGLSRAVALLSALIWLVHPVNLQAVTYIVQRHTSLAGCFSLLALLFYDLGRAGGRKRFYALCVLALLGALLCKETSLVMPAFVFLYDLWFFREFGPGWLRKSWKWFAGLAATYALLAALALRGVMAGKISSEFTEFPFTPWERMLSEGRVLWWYLGLLFLPTGSRLGLEHDFAFSTSLVHAWTTAPAYLMIFAAVGFALLRARRYPLLSFSIIWYFGQLAIEAMPLPIDLANEHRLYLAGIPAIAAVPYLLWLRFKDLKVVAASGAIVALLLGTFTYSRNLVWLTPVKLWRDAVMKSPSSYRPWNNYCTFLVEAGDLNRAGYGCNYAVKLDPSQAEAHANLGLCLFKIGLDEGAESELKKAIELDPEYGIAYFNLGLVYAVRKDFETARSYWEKAMELKPTDAKVYYNLGVIYGKINEPGNAVRAYETALSLRPEWVEARLKVAQALADAGRCPDAASLVKASPVRDKRFETILRQCR